MGVVTVVAEIVAREDAVEAVRGELLKLVAPTRSEKGCLEYRLHQDNDHPAVFIFYENWESEESLQRHMNSDHFKSYVTAVDGLISGKTVRRMTGIA